MPVSKAQSRAWVCAALLTLVASSVPAVPAADAATPAASSLEQQVLDVIRNHPEAILESLSRYQKKQEEQQQAKRDALLRAMKVSPSSYVAGSPVFGSQSAKTLLFVFADFQCPYCAKVKDALQQLVASRPDVALVYKHYPLQEIHPEAMGAARAAWAAQQQGHFWPFHDILYAHQNRLGDELYLEAAKELGLDLVQFNVDRRGERSAAAVKLDQELADGLGLSGTPFFWMNGKTFSGVVDLPFLLKQL